MQCLFHSFRVFHYIFGTSRKNQFSTIDYNNCSYRVSIIYKKFDRFFFNNMKSRYNSTVLLRIVFVVIFLSKMYDKKIMVYILYDFFFFTNSDKRNVTYVIQFFDYDWPHKMIKLNDEDIFFFF